VDECKPLPDGPPFFQYADPATAAAALAAAGFDPRTSRTETVPLTFELAEAADVYDLFAEAGVRMGAVLAAQSPEQRAAILDAMQSGLGEFAEPSPW